MKSFFDYEVRLKKTLKESERYTSVLTKESKTQKSAKQKNKPKGPFMDGTDERTRAPTKLEVYRKLYVTSGSEMEAKFEEAYAAEVLKHVGKGTKAPMKANFKTTWSNERFEEESAEVQADVVAHYEAAQKKNAKKVDTIIEAPEEDKEIKAERERLESMNKLQSYVLFVLHNHLKSIFTSHAGESMHSAVHCRISSPSLRILSRQRVSFASLSLSQSSTAKFQF